MTPVKHGYILLLGLVATICWGNQSLANPTFAELSRVDTPKGQIAISENGYWRYADEGGKRCTKISPVADLCALPSKWSVFPNQKLPYNFPIFVQNDKFSATASPMIAVFSDQPVTSRQIELRIRVLTRTDEGLGAAPHRQLETQVGNRTWRTIPFNSSGFRLVSVGKIEGGVIIVHTRENRTTILTNDHRKAHKIFLESLVLGKMDAKRTFGTGGVTQP